MLDTKNNLSDSDFNKLAAFIYTNYGIKLPITKKIMLESRLKPRLRINNMESYRDYCQFILSGKCGEEEIVNMIDLVSTNKTDFYRESAHFDFMKDVILPEHYNHKSEKPFKVWSSASSSGEEAYTIAIVISEFLEGKRPFDFSILGTDISTRILEKAATAIYPLERVDVIPLSQKKKYLLRGKDVEKPTVRIVPELRTKARFQRLNLMDNSYDVPNDFDLIFCRNVLIYFDRETQEKVINKLCNHLKKGGYFFLGHSESISGYDVPLKQIKPTMFQKI
ncbi:MAG: methyltransferase domain-containing protein [Fluviicola sp.]|nr:methyltransferase domain-containing protein [Fluviicola sp.]